MRGGSGAAARCTCLHLGVACLPATRPPGAAPRLVQAIQESENDKAEIVIVCEPEGMSLQMGGLHPRASLYEKPVNLDAAKQVGAATSATAAASWRNMVYSRTVMTEGLRQVLRPEWPNGVGAPISSCEVLLHPACGQSARLVQPLHAGCWQGSQQSNLERARRDSRHGRAVFLPGLTARVHSRRPAACAASVPAQLPACPAPTLPRSPALHPPSRRPTPSSGASCGRRVCGC